VRPDLTFDGEHYVAFGDVFVARVMEPTEACVSAMARGVGMPDRAMRGWLEVRGGETADHALRRLGAGFAEPGVAPPSYDETDIAAYRFGDRRYVDVDRRRADGVVRQLADLSPSTVAADLTGQVGRVALMGPDSRPLLTALGLSDEAWTTTGTVDEVEILDEPVTIARSDFAGPMGYDLVIGLPMFNAVLAVICSWAVRLELQLLPCGLEAVEEMHRHSVRTE
jgi:hypothetical protein